MPISKRKTNKTLKNNLFSISRCQTHKSHKTMKNNKPNRNWYKYPFEEINNADDREYYDDYLLKNIFTKLYGQKETVQDAGDFPNNIKEYIWGQEGENDGKDWVLLCKLTNGKYAYYIAYCDSTGFDCRGVMKLYVASKIDTLVSMAMDDKYRRQYMDYKSQKH